MKFLYAFLFIICLSTILYSYSKYTNTEFQFMVQTKQQAKQVKQQVKQQTRQQTKQQAKQQVKQQTRQQIKQQVKPQTRKQNVGQVTKKPGTKKLGSTTKKPNKGCPSGQVKVGDSCVKGYPSKDDKCKKGDGLFQGNCFKQADLSEYTRRRRWSIEGSGGYVPSGKTVKTTINGKQVEIMSLGDGNAMYYDKTTGKTVYGTIDAHGGNFSASSSQGSRRQVGVIVAALVALGAAGVEYLRKNGAPQDEINKIFATGVSKTDMTVGKIYSYNGKTYVVNKDGKTISQCTTGGSVQKRALGYRGVGGDALGSCGNGRPSPMPALMAGALAALTLNPQQQRVTVPYNNMTTIQRDAAMSSIQNYSSNYARYLQNIGNNPALSEEEFYRIRAQTMAINHVRVDDIRTALDNNTIQSILQNQGPNGIRDLINNPTRDLTYLTSTILPHNGSLSQAQAQAAISISDRLESLVAYDDYVHVGPYQWFNSVMTNLNHDLQQVPSLPQETAAERTERNRGMVADILMSYYPQNHPVHRYLDNLYNPPPPQPPPDNTGGSDGSSSSGSSSGSSSSGSGLPPGLQRAFRSVLNSR